MTKHWQIDLERGMTEIVIKNNDCCNHRWPQSKAAAKRDANDSNCQRPPFMPGRLQRDGEGKMTWIFQRKMCNGFPDGILAAAAGKS